MWTNLLFYLSSIACFSFQQCALFCFPITRYPIRPRVLPSRLSEPPWGSSSRTHWPYDAATGTGSKSLRGGSKSIKGESRPLLGGSKSLRGGDLFNINNAAPVNGQLRFYLCLSHWITCIESVCVHFEYNIQY